MNFLEKNLEDIIYETNNGLLVQRGYLVFGKKIRQTRIGNYGISDLISYKRCYQINEDPTSVFLDITIHELKKEVVDSQTFFQAIRYAKGIQSYLNKYKPNIDYKISIVLCGKKIDSYSGVEYLMDCFFSLSGEMKKVISICVLRYDYNFDGIKFYSCAASLTNEGFLKINKDFWKIN